MLSAPSTQGAYFVRGARQLVTMRGPAPRRGLSCSDLGVIRDGSLLIEDGRIEEVGSTRRIENLRKARNARLIDVSGKVVLPGLIDSHLRLNAGLPRLRAFEQRIAGLDPAGGEPPAARTGKGASSGRMDPWERAKLWLKLAAAGGATTVELRSGHGAGSLQELRSLRAAAKLNGAPVEALVGFTQACPSRTEPAAPDRVEEILRKASAPIRIATVFDLDCSEGPIEWQGARRWLAIAAGLGYRTKVQADSAQGNSGARLAVEAGALGAERLEAIGEGDIDLLAASSTVATLLPNLAYHLGGGRFPPARRLLDRGAVVSLASGFSPESQPGFGLQMAMALACREMRLMPEEAITCCTINAAAAVGQAPRIGSLEPNKEADLAVFDVSDYREIPYFFGVSLCWLTMKSGRIIYLAGGHGPGSRSRTERE